MEIKNVNDDAPLPCFPNHSAQSPVTVRALRTWCELKHPSCEEVSLTEADISTQIRRPARENPANQRVARRANNNIDAGGRWKNKASQLLVDCWTYGATFSSVFALKIRALLSGNLERERQRVTIFTQAIFVDPRLENDSRGSDCFTLAEIPLRLLTLPFSSPMRIVRED